MKIHEITVHAARTFNHPFENYANFKPGLSLRATLDDGEDPREAVKILQAQAEELAEGQKQQILADLRQLERQARITSSVAATEKQIRLLQSELEQLKKEDGGEQLQLPQSRVRPRRYDFGDEENE